MAFNLPNFNLTFDLWVAPATPAAGPPTFAGLLCQVYVHSKADIDQIAANPVDWIPPIYLRSKIGGPVPAIGDVIQVNYLAFDYYLVKWTQNIHMNFPNEYLMSLVTQCTAAGAIPR